MSKTYAWDDGYSCQNPVVDEQHQFLLALVNRIGRQIEATEDPESRHLLMTELEAYTRFHFLSEENLLRAQGHPDLATMEQKHRKMLEELINRETLVQCAGGDPSDVVEYLGSWFLQHIREEDQPYFIANTKTSA